MGRRKFLPTYYYKDNDGGVLKRSVGKPLRDYKVYGNSVQNGTPTPEAPVAIESVGDRTHNLFDEVSFINMLIEAETAGNRKPIYETIDGKDYFRLYGTNCSYKDANGESLTHLRYSFKENTQYTISFDYVDSKVTGTDGVRRVGILLYLYYTDGTFKDFLVNSGSRPNEAHISFTSQADKTIDYVRFSYGTGLAYTYFANFQIAEGTVENEYEPFGYKIPIQTLGTTNIYLDEPLRKVGNYADYVDFKNGKVARNIGKLKVLDGKAHNAAVNYTNISYYRFEKPKDAIEYNNQSHSYKKYSEHFADGKYDYAGFDNAKYINTIIVTGTTLYCIGFTPGTTLEEMQEALKDAYLYYILAEPKEEPIELPQIPTAKGTCNVAIDTEIQPSGMNWQYYKT